MSVPPPPPPSSPFPPPGPQPYAAQPYPPAAPAYGPPPGPAYGPPPGPAYGPPPYVGQPGGWVPPPPAPRRNVGVIIGIVAAVVVAGGVAVSVLAAAAVGPEPEYRLTVPTTLDGGKYTLVKELSGTLQDDVSGHGIDMNGAKPSGGEYAADGGTGDDKVLTEGFYGRFRDPTRSRDDYLDGMAHGDHARLVVPPRDFTPSGSSEPVRCEVLTETEGVQVLTMPVCGWGDNGTVAAVEHVNATIEAQNPDSVDLQSLADLTAKVRDGIRVKIG